MSFFRSEKMWYCQMVLHKDSVFDCLVELGYMGNVEFLFYYDQGQVPNMGFRDQIGQCVKLKWILKCLQTELKLSKMDIIYYPDVDTDEVPQSKDLDELTAVLNDLQNDISHVISQCEDLQRRHLAWVEHLQVIQKTQDFLTGARNTEPTIASYDSMMLELVNDSVRGLPSKKEEEKARPLNFIAGSIPIVHFASFELMIWRVSLGNAFVKYALFEIPQEAAKRFKEHSSKYAFIVLFVGNALFSKIAKVCEGFKVKIFSCPEAQKDRLVLIDELKSELEDIEEVLSKSNEHRLRILSAITVEYYIWRSKLSKIHRIYAVLNRFSTVRELQGSNQKYYQVNCWIPKTQIAAVRAGLLRGARRAAQGDPHNIFPPMLTKLDIPRNLRPPTLIRTNKFTYGFQMLINSYDTAEYRELNPMPYSIVTFPFLFAIMFGDVGHGILLLSLATYLILHEKAIEEKFRHAKRQNEIYEVVYYGRYIVLLMGIFSIYTGFIYNDVMAKTMNFFGSSWRVNLTFSDVNANTFIQLDPAREDNFDGTPYIFGSDPIWNAFATNSMNVTNSLKMKIAIIFGVIHMMFGLILSARNAFFFTNKLDIYFSFLPRMVFITSLFFYMVVLIFHKWYWFGGRRIVEYSPGCAPSIFLTFIQMVMKRGIIQMPEGCMTQFYRGQLLLERFLLTCAIISVFILLCGKPFYYMYYNVYSKQSMDVKQQRRLRKNIMSHVRQSLLYSDRLSSALTDSVSSFVFEENQEKLSAIWINQGIYTIESVLGTVSHTVSYLRLWALSLAHGQMSQIVWMKVLAIGLKANFGYFNAILISFTFVIFALLTVGIIIIMEGLSAFMHTLRLHWVEFQSKFFVGLGHSFNPFVFKPTRRRDFYDQ